MNYKEDYTKWLITGVNVQETTKKQYLTKLEKLSEIVGYIIFETDDIAKIDLLYNDALKNQKKIDSKYYDEATPSYGKYGWYSASIKTYSQFLKNKVITPANPVSTTTSKQCVKNIFAQAVCVIGDSGVGKTYRVNKTLAIEKHKTLFVIVDNMWQHILFDYSPDDRKYRLTKVGEFIKKASFDKDNYYTIVFDECHKNLEIINDVLLQAISTKRNNGERFFSLNSLVDKQFDFLPERNGYRILPDNLGFLFISSKSDIIEGNDDLNNRIEIIELTEGDQSYANYTIDYLLSKSKKEEQNEYTN